MGLKSPRGGVASRSNHPLMITMTSTTALVVALCTVMLLGQSAFATEVHINSGANGGESTSQASLVTAASEAVKVTTEPAAPIIEALKDGDTIDLDKAETKDPTKKLEIIKQIRKINKDGSYTVGYEAGDGTFKIESRDVLGNIKGTYGYVDAQGEIKRVSYNGNNGTSALKNFPTEVNASTANSVHEEAEEESSTTLPNVNAVAPPQAAPVQRTSLRSMRRPPSLKFLSTTPAPGNSQYGPKSNYIQTIPKRRLGVPSSTERSQYSHYATAKTTDRPTAVALASTRAPPTSPNPDDEQPTPTTIVYAKTVPTQKPLIILRPTTQATSTSQTQEQISRPDKLEINHVSKVMVMKSSETSTSKSINSDKESDRKSIRGNNLRRQLAQEREDHYEAQPQQLYAQNAGEDSQHIFDGGSGNLRPLYSTTNRPRVPSIVLAARQRAAQLQNALNSNSAPTTTTEKVYVRPPPAAIQYETTTSEPAQEGTNYLTQSPSGTVVQIPANNQGIAQQATEDQGSIYGQRPAPFSLRNQQGQQSQYQGTEPPNSLFRFPPPPSARGDQFLRETTPSSSKHHREDQDEPEAYGRHTQQQRPRGGGAAYDGEANYQQGSYPVPYQQQNSYGYFPGQGQQQQVAPFNFPQRPPVTTRDFEMLLQLLTLRHQTPRYNAGGFGAGAGGYGGYNQYNPYLGNPYQSFQQPQYSRSQIYDPYNPQFGYNNNFGGFRQYSEPQSQSLYPNQGAQSVVAIGSGDPSPGQFNDQRGISRPLQRPFTTSNSNYYGANSAPAINPYQVQPQQPQVPRAGPTGGVAGVAPYYQPDFSNVQQNYATQASTQQDYLPSEVREDLLYRMLMLAIQNPNAGGGGSLDGQSAGVLPQLGAFSDPIKSVINNTPIVATGESPPTTHNYNHPQQQQHHHSHHRSNNVNHLVQTATRKPVRSVQIIGEGEEE